MTEIGSYLFTKLMAVGINPVEALQRYENQLYLDEAVITAVGPTLGTTHGTTAITYTPATADKTASISFVNGETKVVVNRAKITNKLDEQGMPCASDVLDKMLSLSGYKITDLINKYFGSNADFNVTFEVDPNLVGTSIDGKAGSGSKMGVKIVLNPDLNNSTEEYILSTLLHESVHGYLNILKTNYPDEYNSLISKYPVYLYNIPQNGNFDNYSQHVIMVEEWVKDIKNEILAFNPSMNNLVAEAISWGGLTTTKPYNLKVNPLLKETITYTENGVNYQTQKIIFYNNNERDTSKNRNVGKKCL